jgi:hypothetical protein
MPPGDSSFPARRCQPAPEPPCVPNSRAFLGSDNQQPRDLAVAAVAQPVITRPAPNIAMVYALSGRCMLATVMLRPSRSKRSS